LSKGGTIPLFGKEGKGEIFDNVTLLIHSFVILKGNGLYIMALINGKWHVIMA
jgi:hypothetical protein